MIADTITAGTALPVHENSFTSARSLSLMGGVDPNLMARQ
jgi:hypothetical protein